MFRALLTPDTETLKIIGEVCMTTDGIGLRYDALGRHWAMEATGYIDSEDFFEIMPNEKCSDENRQSIFQYSSFSVTQVFFSVPTRKSSAAVTWGRISPPISTSIMSSPTDSSPSLSHTRT